MGSYAAAEESLRAVLAKAPGDLGVRQALAGTYLRTGRTGQALETLEPALQRAPDNPILLRTAAEVYLASNNPAKAAEFYERANALDKGNVEGQVRLAQVQMAAGEDTARALKSLETIALANPSMQAADMALISAHLQRHEIDKALAAADAFAKKQPTNPLPLNIKGVIYSSQRDFKSARAAFEEALKVDPKFMDAVQNLARLDLMQRDFDGARKRYEQILAKDPRNEQALLALAGLLSATNAPPADVKAAIDRAISANPTSVRAQMALIAFLNQQRDAKGALAAAQAAATAFPGNAQVLEALGLAQQAAGDNNQALDTLTKAAKLEPQNPVPLLRLAAIQAAQKDFDGAIDTLHRAIALQPDQIAAWSLLGGVYAASGRFEAGLADARKLQKEFPDPRSRIRRRGRSAQRAEEVRGRRNGVPERARARTDTGAQSAALHGAAGRRQAGAGKRHGATLAEGASEGRAAAQLPGPAIYPRQRLACGSSAIPGRPRCGAGQPGGSQQHRMGSQ